ncbi:dihydropteroate synthase [Glaciecola petra]|uniref:Dihydropteroate synthase n=1 Tax=Glaciecola petra TaxID=3075602 RepID=A0ABU2ZPH9_9ALTE|nr:dihydropteroate synthase [Aestuariibacter sp. P117]MDT0594505.1 dihydropteroate synthase [Aestuariibacter sp. P117]
MVFKDKEVIFNSPKVMGILNVTPDSFSDGGKFTSVNAAFEQAQLMVEKGACFIDVGGESTRPGASEVCLQEELDRVVPVIEKIAKSLDVIVSVDTSKPEVMTAAVNAGAKLINDVRALSLPNALETAAGFAKTHNIPTCVMHMQGSPLIMQDNPKYENVVEDVVEFFRQQIQRLTQAGFKYQQIMLDPGFGFGKTLDHNYQMLKYFVNFTQFDLPVLAGMSRKSMIGNLLNKQITERLAGDIATNTIAAMAGASIVRVHDVEEAVDAMKIVDKVNRLSDLSNN